MRITMIESHRVCDGMRFIMLHRNTSYDLPDRLAINVLNNRHKVATKAGE